MLSILWTLSFFKSGNLKFWRLVAKHPNAAFQFFSGDPDVWRLVEGELLEQETSELKSKEWTGPFMLIVPMLGGKTIKVYGRDRDIGRSQEEFVRLCREYATKHAS